MLLLLLASCLLVSFAVGVLIYRKTAPRPVLDRCLVAISPAVGVLVIALAVRYSLYELFSEWNAARLAPVIALRYGYDLYYGPDQGPAQCTIYPPVWAAAYLPASLGATPTQVLLLAGAIAAAFYFGPVLLFHLRRQRWNYEQTLLPLLSLAAFAAFTFESPPLRNSAFWTHADAPALGLGAAACACLYGAGERYRRGCLLASSLCAVLSVGCKQTMAPILVALPLWIAVVSGRRACLVYLCCLALWLVAVSVVVLQFFALGDLFFNLILVPAAHPWKDGSLAGFIAAFGELSRYYLVVALMLGVAVVVGVALPATRPIRVSTYLRANSWMMPMLVGLFTLPTSFVGRLKVGGNLNALSFSLYFFALAAHLLIVAAMTEGAPPVGAAVKKAARSLVLVVLCGMLAVQVPELLLVVGNFQGISQNPQQRAFEHVQRHAGEVYLPWHPLAHLMAEGKLYHFEWGLIDRRMARVPVSDAQFWAHLPAEVRIVCYPPTRTPEEAIKYMPQFRRPVPMEGMSAWRCFARP